MYGYRLDVRHHEPADTFSIRARAGVSLSGTFSIRSRYIWYVQRCAEVEALTLQTYASKGAKIHRRPNYGTVCRSLDVVISCGARQ